MCVANWLENLFSLFGSLLEAVWMLVNNFVPIVSDMAAGVAYVTEQLALAPQSVQNYLSYLPAEYGVYITTLLGALTGLAVVRWVT